MNSIGFVVVCFCFSTFGNELQIQATFRCHVGKFSLPKASCPSPEDHFPLLFHKLPVPGCFCLLFQDPDV